MFICWPLPFRKEYVFNTEVRHFQAGLWICFNSDRYGIFRPIHYPSSHHLRGQVSSNRCQLPRLLSRCNIYARSLRPHTQCTDQYIHAISGEYFAFKYALNFENMMGCRYSCWYFIYNTLKMLQYFLYTFTVAVWIGFNLVYTFII